MNSNHTVKVQKPVGNQDDFVRQPTLWSGDRNKSASSAIRRNPITGTFDANSGAQKNAEKVAEFLERINKSPKVIRTPNKDDNTGRPKIVSILPRQPRFA